MELKQSYQRMIKAFPGGWDAMAGALGMSRMCLENRIYERKGQSLLVETAIQMQHTSGTTFFADAVAQLSGGVFMRMPEGEYADREELLIKFNQLYAELGQLSVKFNESVSDGEIDHKERAGLTDVSQDIHRTVEELMALTFRIYCKEGQ